jgi:hypothetical protein
VTQLTLSRPPEDLSIGVIVTGIIECWVHSIVVSTLLGDGSPYLHRKARNTRKNEIFAVRSNHLVVAEFVENSLVITRNNFLDENSNLAEAGRWLLCRRQNSRYNVRRMPVKVHKAYQALCMTTVGKNRYLASRKSKESLLLRYY